MMKKFLAALSAAALGLGMIALVAGPASAHTGDLSVTAVCNTTTGNYDLTATLKIAQTGEAGSTMWKVGGSTFDGTPTNATKLPNGPIPSNGAQTITLTTFSLPGTTAGLGPWVYAFTTWPDFTVGSDGQLLKPLAGDCAIPVVPTVAKLNLTYLIACAPDATNTWLVTNSSSIPVEFSYKAYDSKASVGSKVPANSTTTFETPRRDETMIVSWGGGATGIAAGSVTKASGIDDTGLSCYPPVACVATPGWQTEDVAPVQGQYGLVFAGPSVKSINYYQRATGNMQGLTGMSYTIVNGSRSGQPVQLVVEVNPHKALDAGGPVLDYATISTNFGPTSTGVLDAQNTLWSSTKITSGPGSLGHPISWSAMIALMPANTLLSAPSLHLLSNSTAAEVSTVISVSSNCGTASFVPVKPTAIRSTTQLADNTVCDPAGGGSYTVTTYYWEQVAVWSDVAHSYSNPAKSQLVQWQAPTTVTVVADTTACPIEVPLDPPVAVDQACVVSQSGTGGFATGYIDIPSSQGVSYFIDGKPAATGHNDLAPGTYQVTAQADGTHSLVGYPTNGWTRKITAAAACGSLVTFPDVTPIVTFAQLGCTTDGSYTLSNDVGAADGVVWTVNGSPAAPGTYRVTTAQTVTVHAEPNGPRYGFSFDQQKDWSFGYAAPTSCSLTTLALATTGSAPVGGVVLGYLLFVVGLGLVIVRAVRRRPVGAPEE